MSTILHPRQVIWPPYIGMTQTALLGDPYCIGQMHNPTWSVSVRDSSFFEATPAHMPWYSSCRQACSASAFFSLPSAAPTALACSVMAASFALTASPDSASFWSFKTKTGRCRDRGGGGGRGEMSKGVHRNNSGHVRRRQREGVP